MNNLSTPMLLHPMKIIPQNNNVTLAANNPGAYQDTSKTKIVYEDETGQLIDIDQNNWSDVKAQNCKCFSEIIPEAGHIVPMRILQLPDQVEKRLKENADTKTEVKSENNPVLDNLTTISTILNQLVQQTAVKATDLIFPKNNTNDSETTNCSTNNLPIPQNCNYPDNIQNPINTYKQPLQSDAICTSQTASKDTSPKLNPALMAQALLRNHKIIMYKKAVYIWDYNCYRLLSQLDLVRICNREFMAEISDSGSYHLLKAIAQFVVSQVKDCDLTEDTSGFIVFQNGVLLLKNNTFIGINPQLSDFLVLHALKTSYSGGQCPIFNAYLYNIAEGKQWLIKRLWQALGLLLSSDVKAKRIVVLVGTGGSGKSTFGNIVREFFHEDNVTSFSPKSLLDRFAGTALVNSAVNICMDLPSLPFDADVVARIKSLSGGDCIEGEIKYMSNFSYIFKGHLLFGSNHPIRLTYPDEAFFERLLLIPCDYKIPQNSRDPHLIERIRPELPAIATIAASYFSEVRNNGYHFKGDDIVNNDMSSLFAVEPSDDDSIRRFIQERCQVTNSSEVYTPIRELFEEYNLFCKQYQHTNSFSINTFSKALTSFLPNSKTVKKRFGKETVNCRTCIIIKKKEDF